MTESAMRGWLLIETLLILRLFGLVFTLGNRMRRS